MKKVFGLIFALTLLTNACANDPIQGASSKEAAQSDVASEELGAEIATEEEVLALTEVSPEEISVQESDGFSLGAETSQRAPTKNFSCYFQSPTCSAVFGGGDPVVLKLPSAKTEVVCVQQTRKFIQNHCVSNGQVHAGIAVEPSAFVWRGSSIENLMQFNPNFKKVSHAGNSSQTKPVEKRPALIKVGDSFRPAITPKPCPPGTKLDKGICAISCNEKSEIYGGKNGCVPLEKMCEGQKGTEFVRIMGVASCVPPCLDGLKRSSTGNCIKPEQKEPEFVFEHGAVMCQNVMTSPTAVCCNGTWVADKCSPALSNCEWISVKAKSGGLNRLIQQCTYPKPSVKPIEREQEARICFPGEVGHPGGTCTGDAERTSWVCNEKGTGHVRRQIVGSCGYQRPMACRPGEIGRPGGNCTGDSEKTSWVCNDRGDGWNRKQVAGSCGYERPLLCRPGEVGRPGGNCTGDSEKTSWVCNERGDGWFRKQVPGSCGFSGNSSVCRPGEVGRPDGTCLGNAEKASWVCNDRGDGYVAKQIPGSCGFSGGGSDGRQCPYGFEMVNGGCVTVCLYPMERISINGAPGTCASPCVPGSKRDAAGHCISESKDGVTCPATEENVGGSCVPKCAHGSTRNSAGICVSNDQSCPATQERQGGQCVPKCSPGETRVNSVCLRSDQKQNQCGCLPKDIWCKCN